MSIYAVALLIVIAFSAYLCCWLRAKYYKMKNIKVILPEGLVAQVSSYKFATNTLGDESILGSSTRKDFHPDISRSSDCLVLDGHKEHLNLISNLNNGSSNALSSFSLSSNSTDHHNEEKPGEHRSLETTNEEISSNCSSASDSNIALQDNNSHIERMPAFEYSTIPVSGYAAEQKTDRANSKELAPDESTLNELAAPQNNAYVTHNSQLLTSLLKASEKDVTPTSQFNLTFPSMTDDGYIQPSAAKQLFQPSFSHHRQVQPTTLNGYTCKESLHKITSPSKSQHETNIEISQSITNTKVPNEVTLNKTSLKGANSPTSIVPLNISSPVTDHQESYSTEYNKDSKNPIVVPAAATSTSPSQQPSDIGSTIHGYVTQQQLASFGTNVVLGK